MSSSVITGAAPTPRPSAPSRLVNVIVDPASAFRAIAIESPWGLAFCAAVVLRFGSLFVFYHPSVTPLKVVGGLLFQMVTILPLLLLVCGLTWVVARAWQLEVGWSPAFSITAHVYVAYTLATIAIASVAGALLPESVDVDLRNPPFTNLSPFVDESSGYTWRLAKELDLRSAYALILTWLGLRAASPVQSRSRVSKAVASIAVVRLVAVILAQSLRALLAPG